MSTPPDAPTKKPPGRPRTPPEEKAKRWRRVISLSVSPAQKEALEKRHQQEARPSEDFSAFLRRLLGLEE
jgi:hypothetical protein